MSIVHPTQRVCTQKKKKGLENSHFLHTYELNWNRYRTYILPTCVLQPTFLSLTYIYRTYYVYETDSGKRGSKKKKSLLKRHTERQQEKETEKMGHRNANDTARHDK